MRHLSLSRAWEETKAIIARDGKLFVSVALALVAFPGVVTGFFTPKGSNAPWWAELIPIAASLIALAGQLALIRLALAPSITVGGAIRHGFYRLPIYFLAALIIVLSLGIAAIPFGAVLAALGVPLQAGTPANSPPVMVAALLYLALILFVGVRMLMSAPVASAEDTGPIEILRRSWRLTAGNWWRLLAFLLLIIVVAFALAIAVRTGVGIAVELALGPIEPLSASALVIEIVLALLNAVLTVLLAVMIARMYVQLSGRDGAEASVPTTGI